MLPPKFVCVPGELFVDINGEFKSYVFYPAENVERAAILGALSEMSEANIKDATLAIMKSEKPGRLV